MLQPRPILAAILTSGLLLAATATAQGRMTDGAHMRADAPRPGPQGAFGPLDARLGHGGPLLGTVLGPRLALGTTVTVEAYDAEPGEGVEPTQTLTLTVGEDSEIAFADALTAARQEAAYLRIETGEQTRTIDLPDPTVGDDVAALGARRGDRRGIVPPLNGLLAGDVVTAAFFDGDPAEGATELARLTFTFGESSAIGFRHDFAEAAADADFVVVTTPPTERVVDLTARPARPLAGAYGSDRGAPRRR
jgi:hypothetical protein